MSQLKVNISDNGYEITEEDIRKLLVVQRASMEFQRAVAELSARPIASFAFELLNDSCFHAKTDTEELMREISLHIPVRSDFQVFMEKELAKFKSQNSESPTLNYAP